MFGRPQLRDLKPADVTIDTLEYFCKTQFIDKLRMERMGKKFDQKLADDMEIRVRHYFVMLKDRSYDVLSGVFFEKHLVDLFAEPGQDKEELLKQMPGVIDQLVNHKYTAITAKAKACIDHYISKLK